jgi:hypothetical protein
MKSSDANSTGNPVVSDGEFLDLRALRPGDIILSRPKSIESTLIAFFGASEFSHAQLVVPNEVLDHEVAVSAGTLARSTCDLVIEATTDVCPGTNEVVGGVGYYRLPRGFLRDAHAQSLPVGGVMPLAGYEYFDVFRHRSATTPAFQRFFEQDIARACERYLNQPYASLHDLAAVSVAPWTVECVASLLKVIPKSPRSGLFCSQLVATLFRDAGFPLTQTKPREVRPADISRSLVLERVTMSIRRRGAPGQVFVEFSEGMEAALPGILGEIAGATGKTLEEAQSELKQIVGPQADFRGRVTEWALRDRVDMAHRRATQLLTSLDEIMRLAQECVARVEASRRSIMTHRQKVDALIADLGKRGVGPSTVAPPFFRLLWALGLNLPPPLFMGFLSLALFTGIFFGVFLGAFMWASMWLLQRQVWQPVELAIASVGAGLLFGLSMAGYIRWKASRLQLPPWESYSGA